MPLDTLLNKAKRIYGSADKNDSVPIYLTLGITRYYADGENPRMAASAIEACNLLGKYYLYYGYDYMNAYRYLIKAFDIISSSGIKDLEYDVRQNFAMVHSTYGSMAQDTALQMYAVELYRKNFTTALEKKDWEGYARTYINLCFAALYNDTVQINRESRDFSRKMPVNHRLRQYALDLGEAVKALKTKDYATSLSKFDSMLSQATRRNLGARFTLLALTSKFNSYLLSDEPDSAQAVYNQCERLARDNELYDVIYSINAYYAAHFLAAGDTANYKIYQLKAFEADDESRHAVLTYQMNRLESQSMLDIVSNTLIENRTQKRQLLFIIIIAVLLLLLAVYYIYNYRKTKARIEHLYNKNRELTNIELKLTSAAESTPSPAPSLPAEEAANPQLYERIIKTLATSPEVYNPDFTVADIAELIGERSRVVSRTLSEGGEMNFTALLTRQRILEACRRMDDKENYGSYTIEAISNSVGFKSRTSFTSAFKKQTGMTPSEYFRVARR